MYGLKPVPFKTRGRTIHFGSMETGKASKTALGVAIRRAAHQLMDVPPVLDDPIAVRLIGQGYRGAPGFSPSSHRFNRSSCTREIGRGEMREAIAGAHGGLPGPSFQRANAQIIRRSSRRKPSSTIILSSINPGRNVENSGSKPFRSP